MTSILPVFLLSILWTTVIPTWAADEKCQRQEVLDPAVRGRAFYVEFPDGRVVTVVGHNHGHRPVQKILDFLNRKDLLQVSNDEFARLVKSILSEVSKPEDEAFRLAGFNLSRTSPQTRKS